MSNRQHPSLEQLVLCEASTHGGTGRPVYHGLVGWIDLQQLPAVLEPLTAVLEIWGPPRAEVPIKLELFAPDRTRIWSSGTKSVPLSARGTCSFQTDMLGVEVRRSGVYRLNVTSAGLQLGGRTLMVQTGTFSAEFTSFGPEILLMALAETVRQDPSGRPTLSGVFNHLTTQAFPTRHPRAVLALEIAGPRFRSFELPMQLAGPGGLAPVPLPSVYVNTRAIGMDAMGVEIQGLVFPQPGIYSVELLHERRVLARRRILVDEA